MLRLYSPPENHLGVIYRKGLFTRKERFLEFVTQQDTTLLWRYRFVNREIRLTPRTAYKRMENVLSADRVPLDVEVKIFYRVDPRNAAPENLLQVLNFPESAFETIVQTNIEELARNVIFISKHSETLFRREGRLTLRHDMSAAIAERVRSFGIIINPGYGVAITNLQPNATFLKALHEKSAATTQSDAALHRIGPMLEAMSQVDLQKALQAIYLQIASAINKTGEIPEYFYPEDKGNGSNTPDHGKGSGQFRQPGGPLSPPPQQPQRMDKDLPTAAD